MSNFGVEPNRSSWNGLDLRGGRPRTAENRPENMQFLSIRNLVGEGIRNLAAGVSSGALLSPGGVTHRRRKLTTVFLLRRQTASFGIGLPPIYARVEKHAVVYVL